jgi:hypothetical protein
MNATGLRPNFTLIPEPGLKHSLFEFLVNRYAYMLPATVFALFSLTSHRIHRLA